MRRVSTATCTSGDPVSPSCVRCSSMISSFCTATANFFFLLFVHFSHVQPVRLFMLPHASNSIVHRGEPANGLKRSLQRGLCPLCISYQRVSTSTSCSRSQPNARFAEGRYPARRLPE